MSGGSQGGSHSSRPLVERKAALKDEERRLRRVRFLMSLTTGVLYQDRELSLTDARVLISNLRGAVLRLFPGQETTFEIVLRPRLERILRERWGRGLETTVH